MMGERDRDVLGRVVREAWIRWVHRVAVPNGKFAKPKWIVPYENISEIDKEADRIIGDAVYDAISLALAEISSKVVDINGIPNDLALLPGWLYGKAVNEDFDKANARRHELIEKKYRNGIELNNGEVKELDRLQTKCAAILSFKFPNYLSLGLFPDLDKLERKLDNEKTSKGDGY